MVKKSLKQQILEQISRCKKRNVFTRNDFKTLGDYDQVGRTLLILTREGKLVRIGYGLYAKARVNRITGSPMIAAIGGFEQAAKEALNLLRVEWQPSIPEQNYNNGSTQIPVNAQVLIKGRFNRTIATNQCSLRIQRH
ncbi:MAG: conjugal transfer protein [Gammaproteobacteria bacterium]